MNDSRNANYTNIPQLPQFNQSSSKSHSLIEKINVRSQLRQQLKKSGNQTSMRNNDPLRVSGNYNPLVTEQAE